MRTQDLQDDYLLQQGVVYLPRSIEEGLLDTFHAQLAFWREKHPTLPLHLICRCDGGDAEEGLATANLIRLDANVYGYLMGMSMSAGATIWAACQKRFVYPNARLGVHPVAWRGSNVEINVAVMDSKRIHYLDLDEASIEILATASNRDIGWWRKLYNEPGDIKWFTAQLLVSMEMAELVLHLPEGVKLIHDNNH